MKVPVIMTIRFPPSGGFKILRVVENSHGIKFDDDEVTRTLFRSMSFLQGWAWNIRINYVPTRKGYCPKGEVLCIYIKSWTVWHDGTVDLDIEIDTEI